MQSSATKFDTACKCGNIFDLHYGKGLSRPGTRHTHVGQGTHRTIAKDMTSKIETGVLLRDDEVADMARDFLNEAWEEAGVRLLPDERTIGELKLKGQSVDETIRLTTLHHKELAPSLEPVSVERKFDLKIPGTEDNIIGFIDIEEAPDDKFRIRDTKTSKAAPKKTALRDSIQMGIYSLAVYAEKGTIPESRLDFLVKTKQPRIEIVSGQKTELELGAIIRRAIRVIDCIKAGKIPPAVPGSDWWCSPEWCGFWDICKYV